MRIRFLFLLGILLSVSIISGCKTPEDKDFSSAGSSGSSSGTKSVSSSAPSLNASSKLSSSKTASTVSFPAPITNGYPLSDQTNKGGWTRYEPMSDEFEGTSLDSTKWVPKQHYWDGREAYFDPNNVRLENGKLILTTKYNPSGIPYDKKTKYPLGFTAACVSSTKTNNKGMVRYGYFEIKAKAANECVTSSFWFQDPKNSGYRDGKARGTEIDVFEMVGNTKTASLRKFDTLFPINLHEFPSDWSKDNAFPFEYKTPGKVRDNFYVYGLEWLPNELNFYFNGVKVHTQENIWWKYPQYMFFDMEIFKWHGYPSVDMVPADFEIEYIRAWKNAATR